MGRRLLYIQMSDKAESTQPQHGVYMQYAQANKDSTSVATDHLDKSPSSCR